jgi:hypothetical protein
MDKELWKPIAGYEGYFEISTLGRVKSVERYVEWCNSRRYVKERIKKLHIGAYGYPSVTLCKDGKSVDIPIHRLLARTFIPNPDNKPYIDHINTDITDYRLDNLRWVTAKENANNPLTLQHCKTNTYIKQVSKKANATKVANGTKTAPKNVFQYSKDGLFIAEYDSYSEAERCTGVNHRTISIVCDDNTSSAGGFLWFSHKASDVKYQRRIHPTSKPIIQYDKFGSFIKEWNSIREASISLGIPTGNIIRSINNEGKPRKYKFRFKE